MRDTRHFSNERGTTCYRAKQDKCWVEGTPNGERWEVYTVLANSPTFSGSLAVQESGCCGNDGAAEPEPKAGVCC